MTRLFWSLCFSSLPWMALLLLFWLGALTPKWILGVMARLDREAVVAAELVVTEVVCEARPECTVRGEIVLSGGDSLTREVVVEAMRARALEVGDSLAVVVNVRPGSNVFGGSLRQAASSEDLPARESSSLKVLRGPALALGLWALLMLTSAVARRGGGSDSGDVIEVVPRPSLMLGLGPTGVATGLAVAISGLAGWGGPWWAALVLLTLGVVCWHQSAVRIDRRAGTLVRVRQFGPLRRSGPPTALGTPQEVRLRTIAMRMDVSTSEVTRFDVALATREGEHQLGSFAVRSDAKANAERLAGFLGVPYAGP